jgi:RecG-like helicase
MGRVARAMVSGEFRDVKISEIDGKLVGQNVKFKGLVGAVERYDLKVCVKCRKKECVCEGGSPGLDDLIRWRLIVGDESGLVNVTFFTRPNEVVRAFEAGDEVVVRGRVKFSFDDEESGRVEVVAQDVEVLSKPKISYPDGGEDNEDLGAVHPLQRVIDFVVKAKKVRRDIVERMCQKYGVNIDDVIDVLEVEGDYIVGKFKGDEHGG